MVLLNKLQKCIILNAIFCFHFLSRPICYFCKTTSYLLITLHNEILHDLLIWQIFSSKSQGNVSGTSLFISHLTGHQLHREERRGENHWDMAYIRCSSPKRGGGRETTKKEDASAAGQTCEDWVCCRRTSTLSITQIIKSEKRSGRGQRSGQWSDWWIDVSLCESPLY